METLRQPLSRQIASRIRQRIRSGELLPGQRLNERELMESMSASRTPLREALSILAGERLVELSASRGAVVTSQTDAEIDAMVGVRGTLERLAGLCLARSATAAEIDGLAALCDAMDTAHAAGDASAWWQGNSRFHRSMIGFARNAVLLEYWENIAIRMTAYNFFNVQGVTTTARWAESGREHRAILDLLTRRDGEALGTMLERHLTESWIVARQLVRERGAPDNTFTTLFRQAKAVGA